MLAHPADQQVVVEACRSLVNLSGTDDNAGKVVAGGGIECITASMRRIPENVELQLLSCWCLMHLTNPLYNPEYQIKLVAAGGISDIINAMKTHKTNSWVQELACRAFHQLASRARNQAIDQMVIDQMVTAGVVERTISALRRHDAHAGVKLRAGRTLAVLVIRDAKDLKTSMVAVGGIECIINAMRGHTVNGEMQREAIQALAILAYSIDNGRLIVKAGGLEAIADAMRHHKAQSQQFAGCHAFFQIAIHGTIAPADTIIECIIDAMNTHKEDKDIQRMAMLADNHDNKVKIAQAGEHRDHPHGQAQQQGRQGDRAIGIQSPRQTAKCRCWRFRITAVRS
jgi:hypothetical protein